MRSVEHDIRIGKLITLYLSGKTDVSDRAELNTWLDEHEANAILFASIVDEVNLEDGLREISSVNVQNALDSLRLRIEQDVVPIVSLNSSSTGKKSQKSFIRYASVAASVLIAIGIWAYYQGYIGHKGQSDGGYVNIAPGKNKATLTLANGKVIQLSEKKSGVEIDARNLAYNDGTPVDQYGAAGNANASSEKMLTLSTPRGGTYIVKLPDGTMVTMNAESSLQFPSKFSLKERLVILQGEAYFTVKHNSRHPFRVYSGRQLLEDLGTAFNINAYADDGDIKTTLLSGSAQVSLNEDKLILVPGQQSILRGNSLAVRAVNPELAVAWKNGNFMFKSEPLGEIMKKVQRWYDVDVMYKDRSLIEMKFSGTISRYENVSKLLDMLQTTGLVEFRTEGKKITIYKQ